VVSIVTQLVIQKKKLVVEDKLVNLIVATSAELAS